MRLYTVSVCLAGSQLAALLADGAAACGWLGPFAATLHHCLQVVEFMHNNMHSHGNLHYKAFYSSEIGGIVTEPPLMVLPIDDHMVSWCSEVTTALHLGSLPLPAH